MTADNATTFFFAFVAVGTIVWGFIRARPYGKLGILTWLQSIILLAPWLLFFGLFALGIYVNFAFILFLFLIAVAIYIYLGRRLREMGQEQMLRDRAAKLMMEELQARAKAEEAQEATQQEADPEAPGPAEAPEESTLDPSLGRGTGSPMSAPLDPRNRSLPSLPLSPFRRVPQEDLQKMKGIFGIDTFFATETVPYQDGVIFKGNLRGEAQSSYRRMAEKLEATLGDRYRLYLVADPTDRPTAIVLPSSNIQRPLTRSQQLLGFGIFLVTVFTVLERGGLQYGFDVLQAPDRILEALPIGLGLLASLVGHELGHWWMARRYEVRLGFPFFIPSWQLGSFGAITRFESILPDRTVLFDISIAGPAIGGALALLCLLAGMVLPAGDLAIELPTPFFQGSLLVGSIARVVLGGQLQENFVNLHPLFVAGWLGLVITALNLVPLGQLDGGRIVQAIYGRKVAGRTTIVAIVFLVVASFFNPIALYWAILSVFLQRQQERPNLEEITEPDDTRALWGLVALLLTLLVLLPFTPALAARFGIGAPGAMLV
ncbi:MAG: site-2 protease family protein, partial [Prochlorothrix sp.]